jgi:hypothetical protein
MINIKRSILIALLFLPAFVFAADLTEVELNDDDYLLLSVVVKYLWLLNLYLVD